MKIIKNQKGRNRASSMIYKTLRIIKLKRMDREIKINRLTVSLV